MNLKYELSHEVVNTILSVLDKTPVTGIQSSKALLDIVQTLQNPLNKDEIEKGEFEKLKAKFEPKKEQV